MGKEGELRSRLVNLRRNPFFFRCACSSYSIFVPNDNFVSYHVDNPAGCRGQFWTRKNARQAISTSEHLDESARLRLATWSFQFPRGNRPSAPTWPTLTGASPTDKQGRLENLISLILDKSFCKREHFSQNLICSLWKCRAVRSRYCIKNETINPALLKIQKKIKQTWLPVMLLQHCWSCK